MAERAHCTSVSLPCFLASMVSHEKSVVNLIEDPLHMVNAAFLLLSLFSFSSTFSSLIMMHVGMALLEFPA